MSTDSEIKPVSEGIPQNPISIPISPTTGEPIPPLPPAEVEKLKKNKAGREAAEALLELVKEEHGENTNPRFWEVLRDEAIKRVGVPMKDESKELAPFDTKRAIIFQQSTFTHGKYADMTVGAVEKKEGLEFLLRFATKQNFFQRGLSRYCLWRKFNPEKKKKAKKKKK